MARGLVYTVAVVGGLKVKALNVEYVQGQIIEIDPAFLAVNDELKGYIRDKLLVSLTSEYRHGGPTGLVPSGDEMAILRRAVRTGPQRAAVVVNNVTVERDQVLRDHFNKGLNIRDLARQVANEMTRDGKKIEMTTDPLELGEETEARIADKVAQRLLPELAALIKSMPARQVVVQGGDGRRQSGVIEVEQTEAALPDTTSKEKMETHLQDDFAKTSTGEGVGEQLAHLERLLNQSGKKKENNDNE